MEYSIKFYTYELWDPIKNEPFYVGKGTNNPGYVRHSKHIKMANNTIKDTDPNRHKIHRIKKILSLGYTPETKIVFETDIEEEALNKEIELIKLYGRRNLKTGCLTNLTPGGEGFTQEYFTQEKRDEISKRVSGSGNWMYGKTHTPEARKAISDAHKGRTNYYHTEEWKRYLSSEESYLRKRGKSVYQIDTNGNIINKWKTCLEAAVKLNYPNYINIYSAAKYKYRRYKGFYWLYEEDVKIENNKLINIDELNELRLDTRSNKSIIQYDLEGNIIKTWKSAMDIVRSIGCVKQILHNVVCGKRKNKVYKGFIWKFAST